MRALLIDDEPRARKELRRLLAVFPDIELAGEAADAVDGREQIAALKPNLLFLDIQMPEETGMELLESLEPPVPTVVFTTAYDQFAMKAFELNALDYLLKPVDPSRLAVTVERLRAIFANGPDSTAASTARHVGDVRLCARDKVFVREGDRCWFVEISEIRLLESEGSYVRVHFGNVQPRLFRSLNALEARLDSKYYFRANRSQIINLNWIERIEPWFSGGLVVHLRGGAKVELSRRKAQAFRERTSL
jgi:two-component system LytT family response regulator